ncbi:MAG: serine--tRNA ligase [Candidatus Pacebacteria bacterium]|nr:serine--tRNA ligase [Candidatus Paceibacterota bacterium]
MLDLNFIRQNPTQVKQACQAKQLDDQVVDQLLTIDQRWRQLIQQTEQIRQQINQNAADIKKIVSQSQPPPSDKIEHGRQLKQQLKDLEPELKELETRLEELSLQIPNLPASDVPVGTNENDNQVIKTWGEKPAFDFQPQHHDQLMTKLDWLDSKRGVKVAGFRGYFLKNQAVLLEQALLQHALNLMIKHDFTPMTVPVLVKPKTLMGTGFFPWGQEDHYNTQDNKVLIGTAEVPLTSYYMDEVLNHKDLPIKMAGISSCFRREVGDRGRDTRGLVRVHQFNKVEQVVLTVANETATQQWHQKMLGFAEELLQSLALPYQVVLMCTGDMGAGQRKKYDLETWFPAQNKYRETHSCSYFNDFQARRLNIRYQAKDGSLKHVYTLNNTVAATPRLLAAVIENYQQKDGSIKIPAVLQKLIGTNSVAVA